MSSKAEKPRRIIWLQAPPWDGVWTRQNHFSRRFARDGVEVLYVENPQALGARLKKEGVRALLRDKAIVREVEPGLRVMSLPVQLPGGRHFGPLGWLNGRRFAGAIQDWLASEGWTDYLAWCRVPASIQTLDALQPKGVVYDVTDDYEYYARSDHERTLTIERERRLAQRADQIFTTTEQLREKLSALNPATTVVPNGVDPKFFDDGAGEEDPLSHVPRPRIGFVGLVARWMDFELLEKLGARWPGQVVIVGPVSPEAEERYAAIPGLVRVGHVHHLDVPRYLRAFDVCVLPHEVSELRHRADPLKIVEYLATGKPTVSVALRSVTALEPLVDVAVDHDAFLRLVAQRLEDPGGRLASERKAFAAKRGWDSLYETVKAKLDVIGN